MMIITEVRYLFISCCSMNSPSFPFSAFAFRKFGKKKIFKHKEHNSQLNYYHCPKCFTQCHVPKPIIIEVKRTIKEIVFVHCMKCFRTCILYKPILQS